MKKNILLKFKSSIISKSRLKTIKGGYGESSGECTATALCNANITISCSGSISCSGTDYDRVVCDGKITNCPECN